VGVSRTGTASFGAWPFGSVIAVIVGEVDYEQAKLGRGKADAGSSLLTAGMVALTRYLFSSLSLSSGRVSGEALRWESPPKRWKAGVGCAEPWRQRLGPFPPAHKTALVVWLRYSRIARSSTSTWS